MALYQKKTIYISQSDYDTLYNNGSKDGTITKNGVTYSYDSNALYLVPNTMDSSPTANSTNPVTSGGLYNTLKGYLLLTGGTMNGDLNVGNTTIFASGSNGGLNSILIGDDAKLGDCNVGGHIGVKSNNTDNAGFSFYTQNSQPLGRITFTTSGAEISNNVHAKTFIGNLSGTADKAVYDTNGLQIDISYGKLASSNTWANTNIFNNKIVQHGFTDFMYDSVITDAWTGYFHSIDFTAQNMADGSHLTFAQGGYTKTYLNQGYLSFYKSSSGSNLNYVSIGLWGVGDILKVRGDNTVLANTFIGNLSGTASKATADANGNVITDYYRTIRDSYSKSETPLRRFGSIVDTTSTVGTTWGKVADITMPKVYINKSISFLVEGGTGNLGRTIGILRLNVRNDNSATDVAVYSFSWMVKTGNDDYPLSSFVAIQNGLSVSIYVKTSFWYDGITLSELDEYNTSGNSAFGSYALYSVVNPTITDLSTVAGTKTVSTMDVIENTATNATNATNDDTGNRISTTYLSKSDASSTYVHKTGDETIAGTKSFSSTINGSISGNSSTATALTTSAGNSHHPIYFSNGKPVVLDANEGSASVPVYLSSGSIQPCSCINVSFANVLLGGNVFSASSAAYNVVIGRGAADRCTSSGLDNIVIGANATCNNTGYNVLIGGHAVNNASAPSSSGGYDTIIGYNARTTYSSTNGNVVLGANANSFDMHDVVLGASSYCGDINDIAIGYGASVSGRNTIQLGNSGISTFKCQVGLSITSDERDKTDIENIDCEKALNFISDVTPITYVRNIRDKYVDEKNKNDQYDDTGNIIENKQRDNYKKYGLCEYDKTAYKNGTKKGTRRLAGVSAQKVQKALQEIYGTDNYANIVNDNFYDLKEKPTDVENQLTVQYDSFIPFLIASVKELKKENEDLTKRIEILENKLKTN